MKKRNYFIITCLLILSAGLLTACNLFGGGDKDPKKYTVTFNHGYSSWRVTQEVEEGGKAVKPVDDPVYTDYVFAGWYKDTTRTIKWNFDTDTVSGNTELYARWVYNISNSMARYAWELAENITGLKCYIEEGYLEESIDIVYAETDYSDGQITKMYYKSLEEPIEDEPVAEYWIDDGLKYDVLEQKKYTSTIEASDFLYIIALVNDAVSRSDSSQIFSDTGESGKYYFLYYDDNNNYIGQFYIKTENYRAVSIGELYGYQKKRLELIYDTEFAVTGMSEEAAEYERYYIVSQEFNHAPVNVNNTPKYMKSISLSDINITYYAYGMTLNEWYLTPGFDTDSKITGREIILDKDITIYFKWAETVDSLVSRSLADFQSTPKTYTARTYINGTLVHAVCVGNNYLIRLYYSEDNWNIWNLWYTHYTNIIPVFNDDGYALKSEASNIYEKTSGTKRLELTIDIDGRVTAYAIYDSDVSTTVPVRSFNVVYEENISLVPVQ